MIYKLWNDAYHEDHQFITNDDGMILYDRQKGSEDFEFDGGIIQVIRWSEWYKLEEPTHLKKSWFVKTLSIDDMIRNNYEKENEKNNENISN